MDEELKELFRTAIRAIIKMEDIQSSPEYPFIARSPRTFFLTVIGMISRKLTCEELSKMEEEFPEILQEFYIKIAPGQFLKKMEKRRKRFPKRRWPSWINARVMRGARAAEYRHQADSK